MLCEGIGRGLNRGAVSIGTGEIHITPVQGNRRSGLNLFDRDEQRHEK